MNKFKVGDIVASKEITHRNHVYGIVVGIAKDTTVYVSWRGFTDGHDCGIGNLPFGERSGWKYMYQNLKPVSKQMEFDFENVQNK